MGESCMGKRIKLYKRVSWKTLEFSPPQGLSNPQNIFNERENRNNAQGVDLYRISQRDGASLSESGGQL